MISDFNGKQHLQTHSVNTELLLILCSNTMSSAVNQLFTLGHTVLDLNVLESLDPLWETSDLMWSDRSVWGSGNFQTLLDFYEHVGDAERQRPRQVDQDKRVHAGQQHTAQTWNYATQTVNKQTNKITTRKTTKIKRGFKSNRTFLRKDRKHRLGGGGVRVFSCM